jgi:hypothetical protein
MLPDTTMLDCSVSMAERLGWSPQGIIGKQLAEIRGVRSDHCAMYLRRLRGLSPTSPDFEAAFFYATSEAAYKIPITASATFGANGQMLLVRVVCDPEAIEVWRDDRPLPPTLLSWRCRLYYGWDRLKRGALQPYLVPFAKMREILDHGVRLGPRRARCAPRVRRGERDPTDPKGTTVLTVIGLIFLAFMIPAMLEWDVQNRMRQAGVDTRKELLELERNDRLRRKREEKLQQYYEEVPVNHQPVAAPRVGAAFSAADALEAIAYGGETEDVAPTGSLRPPVLVTPGAVPLAMDVPDPPGVVTVQPVGLALEPETLLPHLEPDDVE